MAKVQISCPRCRQPIVAEMEQLFDVGADPSAKQRFLSGNSNVANCPHCGYQGPLSTPIVYHDPEKELLLTYFPPDLGLPVNEQERLIGPMITKVLNALPPEKRKAYLLRPQTMFTLQLMMDKVLEGEGITREMMEASQARLNLLQRLITASSAEVRQDIIRQDEKLIDERFFEIMNRVIEASSQSGDENTARALAALQQEILPLTEIGRKLQAQSQDVQTAVKSLQAASESGLTREKLLDLMISAPSETQLTTMISMARSGMDDEFFNVLTTRVDTATGEEQEKLATLRDHMLKLIEEIDKRVKEQLDASRKLLEQILTAEDVEKATTEAFNNMDDFFAEALRTELEESRGKGDMARMEKLQKVVEVIQRASTPPAELDLAEELMGAEDEAARKEILQSHADDVTPKFLELLSQLVSQLEGQGQKEMAQQLQSVYRSAVRFSMENNLKK